MNIQYGFHDTKATFTLILVKHSKVTRADDELRNASESRLNWIYLKIERVILKLEQFWGIKLVR